MLPAFSDGISDLGSLPLFYMLNVISHAILGTVAEVIGLIVVSYWLWKSPKNMQCVKMKCWMMPLFIIWVISLINGALIHIVGML